MVTHDNRILDVADRIVNMVDGRIKSDVVVQESALICEFLQKLRAVRQTDARDPRLHGRQDARRAAPPATSSCGRANRATSST